MMRWKNATNRRLWLGFGLIVVAATNAGCGSSATEPAGSEDDRLLAELLGESADAVLRDAAEESAPESAADRSAESDAADGKRGGSKARPVSRSRDAGSAADGRRPPGERLELRLQRGDRFPLFKTVEQTLVQKSDASPLTARTRLDLAMAISVEETAADSILLGVRYSWLSYEHDINGQRLKYDSRTHQGEVPWDAIPYAGMVGNGFAFRLSRDNTIREMVGYQEFLQRCVEGIPVERRQSLLNEISTRFGDDGVANFVDESVGLLPYDSSVDPDSATRVMVGDVWTRERRLMQPVPTYLTNTYRLTALDDQKAEIDITGRIASGEAVSSGQNTRIRITGGHSLGQCIVDRASGIPVDVQISRNLTIAITTADNQEVVQDKQIVTTIRAFPEIRGQQVSSPQASGVRPAAATDSTGSSVTPIPTQSAKPGSTVRANYPD